MKPTNPERCPTLLLALAATLIAIVSARPYAGSFNDGSRLAVVESLVDRGTLAIDDSIFVQPPPPTSPARLLPYQPDSPWLPQHGTYDKVRINGRFYSDKPPVQAMLMAGVYWLLKWSCGLDARVRTDLFCYFMTLTSSGLSYVLAVVFAYRLQRTLGLPRCWSLLVSAALGLATIALPYARQVNGHIVLLAVAMLIFDRLAVLADRSATPGAWSFGLLGALAGLAYALEQVTGGLMLAGTLGVLFLRHSFVKAPLLALLGALPWLVLHHGLLYTMGGTLAPLGSIPAYLEYPGSGFDTTNMTGRWHHANLFDFAYYAGGLLFGSQGFLLSNLPLLLAVPAAPFLWHRVPTRRVEVLFAAGLCVGTWLVYAALSNNYSGYCCSIRWFVPLLAPGFFFLGLLLREWPRWRIDFLILSMGELVLGALMWWSGPWESGIVAYWPIVGTTLAIWVMSRIVLSFSIHRVEDQAKR